MGRPRDRRSGRRGGLTDARCQKDARKHQEASCGQVRSSAMRRRCPAVSRTIHPHAERSKSSVPQASRANKEKTACHARKAGGVGFEPTDELPHQRFSRPSPSSARPSSRLEGYATERVCASRSGPLTPRPDRDRLRPRRPRSARVGEREPVRTSGVSQLVPLTRDTRRMMLAGSRFRGRTEVFS